MLQGFLTRMNQEPLLSHLCQEYHQQSSADNPTRATSEALQKSLAGTTGILPEHRECRGSPAHRCLLRIVFFRAMLLELMRRIEELMNQEKRLCPYDGKEGPRHLRHIRALCCAACMFLGISEASSSRSRSTSKGL